MDHILNRCTKVSRNAVIVDNIYDTSDVNTSTILRRVEDFRRKVDVVSGTPTSQE